jgi:hypothetical protein
VPLAGGDGPATVPDARRRHGSGASVGDRNALRHGRYSREVLEFRHAMRELLRENAEKLELVQGDRPTGIRVHGLFDGLGNLTKFPADFGARSGWHTSLADQNSSNG